MGIRSILVIPFADGIGDFINMQPLLAVIRARFPEAAVSVAVSEHGGFLCNDPAIRPLKPSGFNHEPGKLAINFRWLLPQTVLAWCAGPLFEFELGPFDLVINCFFAWERAMDFRRTWTPQSPPQPEVVHSLNCLADELEMELGVQIPPDVRRPYLVLRTEAKDWAAAFLREQHLGDGPLVALVPGTNMLIKRWPCATGSTSTPACAPFAPMRGSSSSVTARWTRAPSPPPLPRPGRPRSPCMRRSTAWPR